MIIDVNYTLPTDPKDEPIILLTIGETTYAIDAVRAIRLAETVQNQIQDVQIPVTIGETTYTFPPEGAMRLAKALKSQVQNARIPQGR